MTKCPHALASALAGGVISIALAGCESPTEVVPTLPPVDSAAVLLFDDFDRENSGVGALNWKEFRQWSVIRGCVDLHGNGFYDVQPGKGLYVDLDGTCKGAGTIETRLPLNLQPGEYILEFWLAGNQRRDTPDTVVVSLGDLFEEQITLGRREPFRLYSRNINITVMVSTTAKLVFTGAGGDDEGILLDLVRLRRSP